MLSRVFRVAALILLVALATSCAWLAYRHDPRGPQVAGSLELPGLTAAVEVIRDKWGIPHVFAQNELDLMRAMGYVHAQDRLFQMDIMRRVVNGRLSEIVGDQPLAKTYVFGGHSTREQDIGMRIIGFEHTATIAAEVLPAESMALLDAYAEGVNAYILQNSDNLPIEFTLIGYEPSPWEPKDTIALQRFLGWMLSTNARVELLQAAADQVLGVDKAAQLLPAYQDSRGPRILPDYKFPFKKPSLKFDARPIAPLDEKTLTLGTLYRLLDIAPAPEATAETTDASNNWVVSGARAVRGKPILANDPHLPHLAPSVFHLIHLSGAGYDTIGASFPGVPLVILGHNRHVAWAATNNQADVEDFYVHKIDEAHPERYLYGDTWEDFVQRDETVSVKDGGAQRPETFTVRVSRFGPVVTDLFARDRTVDAVSLRWTGMDITANPDAFWAMEKAKTPEERQAIAAKYLGSGRGLDTVAFRQVNRAASCDDYFKAMSYFGCPRQNWICGDDAGHIGYVAAGFVPVRNRGDGRRIARAWKDEGRWTAFIPFEELPQRRDPRSGFIATANNITMDLDAYPYPWAYNYSPRYRAERIVALLTAPVGAQQAAPLLDDAAMKRIQGDIHSNMAEEFVPLFTAAAKSDEALTDARLVLERWDRQAAADSPGAALFYTAMDELVRKLLRDHLGPDLYNAYVNTSQASYAALQLAADKKSIFHSLPKSKQVGTWDLTYRRALSAAYASLQRDYGADPQKWRWGQLHELTNAHPLGGKKALASSVNLGPNEQGGACDTVWASFFDLGADNFTPRSGPAYRHIVDLAAPERSWIVLDTGEWGQPLTEHYGDLHELWQRNDLAPGLLNRADIEENVSGTLTLEPAKMP
jgi:penicillin amidase